MVRFMMFVEMTTAFNNVDRDILWRELRRREIKETLIRKESIYIQIEVVIRIYGKFQDKERCTAGACVESTLV